MSTDTLFRSIPTASLNDPPKNDTTNTTVVPAPVLLDAHVVSTPSVLTPNVELNNTSLFPNTTLPAKKDVSSIPPAFFVGPLEKEDTVIFEPEFSTGSGSVVSYGDRRLSGILAEANDKREGENNEENIVPVKRVVLGTADANRGIFGDKKFKVSNNIAADCQLPTIIEASPSASHSLQPSRTVRVFGYPPNLVHNVIQHFSNYGKIEKYQEGPGNWITITYETNSMALSALKSNGMAISKSYLIGVSLEKEEAEVQVEHVVPMDVSNGVFKKTTPVSKNGLGSGKVGVSAENKDNASTGSFVSRLKDTFFGW